MLMLVYVSYFTCLTVSILIMTLIAMAEAMGISDTNLF